MDKILVVGTGAGGAILAKDLSKMGFEITLIEKGPCSAPGDSYNQYANLNTEVEILKTECVGGATMVSAGNAVRTCEKELKKYNIDIENELNEVELELKVNYLPDHLMGAGTKIITDAAHNLGFSMKKMPKFIDPTLCRPCGKCSLGCPQNAKWTAQEFVREASEYGAKILKDREVTEIIHYKGVVKGVKCGSKEYFADKVILCAGAIETPRLLQKADINAGENLFVDTFVTVGGVLKDINFYQEISMYSLIEKNDIILAPHYSGLLLNPLRKYGATENDILGMMIKIKDENSGQVLQDKAIKYNTSHDTSLIASGASMAGAILSECGVNPNTLVSTPSRGAHPGGTAPIGKVVDINLETEIEGLFVADASVLPCAPGAPPIITILALSKRLAKYLATIQV